MVMKRILISLILLLEFTLCVYWSVDNALAQALPGAADPGRIQQNTAPRVSVPVTPEVIAPIGEEALDLELPEVLKGFTLKSVKVVGNTVIDEALFDEAFQESIGTKVNLESLRILANRATLVYRKNGYFLSRVIVPEQDSNDGHVTLAAVEGYASDVVIRFEEATPAQSAQIDAMLNEIKPRIVVLRPLQSVKLQDILLRLNALGGISVSSVIEPLPPSKASPGAVRLSVIIKKMDAAFSLGMDNFGSRFSGPFQSRAGAVINPNLIAFDRFFVTALTSIPTDELNFFAAGYEVPVNYNGTFVGANISVSYSEPGYTLRASRIESNSFSFEPYVRHPWAKTRKYSVTSQLSLDYRNSDSDTLGTELFTDRIRALRFSNDFNYNDGWQGVNSLNLRLSQGLDILDSTQSGDRNLSRAQGRSDFTKLDGTLSRLQQLTNTLQIFTAVSGQYTDKPLLSSEEFGYGGQSFGRAYDPSELLGDRGIAGAAELRYYGISPVMNVNVSPFAFYDIGRVWNIDTGSTGSDSAASAGIGARLWHPIGISSTLAVAMPLTKEVNAPIFGNTARDPRVMLEVQYGF